VGATASADLPTRPGSPADAIIVPGRAVIRGLKVSSAQLDLSSGDLVSTASAVGP
jgi:hypothetical protein